MPLDGREHASLGARTGRYCDSDRPCSSRPAQARAGCPGTVVHATRSCFHTRLLSAAALPCASVLSLGRLLPNARRIRYRLPKKALALPALRARGDLRCLRRADPAAEMQAAARRPAAAGKPATAAAAAARCTTATEQAAALHMVEMLDNESRPYQSRELTSPTGATRCS
ncbi:hypothetical protein T492DRAFT_921084, partial [Pavlovales sp. CCMP2436]